MRTVSAAIVVAMVLYVAMAMLADLDAFGRAISLIPAIVWIEVTGLSLVSYLARFVRWHRYLRALGHRIPVARELEIYLSGFALTLTPGKSGEMIRSAYLHPYGVSYPHSIAAFIAERMLDLVAVGLLACLGLSMFDQYRFWALGAVVCGLALVVFFRSRWLSYLYPLARRRLGKHTHEGIESLGFLLAGPRFVKALPLSFVAWAAQGFSLYLIVDALGYERISAATNVAIYCLSILAGAASFIPGGLGATEGAIALLLTGAGASPGDAIAAALVSRGLTLWLAIAIGIGAMSKLAFGARAPASK